MTVIYADVYFLINFAADYLILLTCSKLFGRKIMFLKIVISSVLGAGYALLSAFFLIDGIVGIILNVVLKEEKVA